MLDLSSLQKGVKALERAYHVCISKEDSGIGADESEVLQAGLIQSFEFAYELCWKFMKRWIDEQVDPELVQGVPRIELFRVAAQNGLIDDVDLWMGYHRARNMTSHIYDSEVSERVYTTAKTFLYAAKDFLQVMEKKNV